MRFRKHIPEETRKLLTNQLKQYKEEMHLTREENRELEKWVADGHSPYENGDFIYTDYGCPMDFVSAMRAQRKHAARHASLTEDECETESCDFYTGYDTVNDDIMIIYSDRNDDQSVLDEELPFK